MNNPEEKIILIDDSEEILAILSVQLEAEGFTVHTATNVPEAEQLLTSIIPNIIILDYHMPHESGLDFLARIRSKDRDTPVIMLTADTRKEVVIMALRHGANDFHPKPYDFDFLLISIKREIKKRELEMHLRHALTIQQVMLERAKQLEEFSHEIRTATHHILSFAEIAKNIVDAGHCENIKPPLEQIKRAAITIQQLISATEKAAEDNHHGGST